MQPQSKGSTPPKGLSASLTLREGIEVDVPMQMARVTNACYGEQMEYWETTTIETPTGPIALSKMRTESRCHKYGHTECEIFQDHAVLGLDTGMLPCCGAPAPDEITAPGVVEEGIDVLNALREIANTNDIYPPQLLTGE